MTWVPTVSPTQIDDFNLCERKWGFRTLVKGAYVQNIGAFRGDYGHRMLEAWGKDRTPPEAMADEFALQVAMQFSKDLDEKRISAADYAARLVGTVNKMTPFLLDHGEPPFPGIERDFRVVIQGVTWSGRKDLEFSKDTVNPAVLDYKFTSAPEYAKTDEQLPHDPQSLTYAFEKFYREASPSVTVKLLYGHVAYHPKAWTVQHTFTPEECAENIRPHTETAKQIVQLRLRRPDPLSLTPNWLACPCMGGCSFQDRCKPTPEQLLEAHANQAFGLPPTKPIGDKKMGLLSQLAGSTTLPTASTPQAPAAASVGAQASTEARSDSAAAIADLVRDAGNLLRLGITRAEVVKAMAARYVGLAAVADSLVPVEAVAPANPTPAPAVNSGPPPGVEPKPEPEPKAAKQAKANKALKDHAEAQAPTDEDAELGRAFRTLLRSFKAL